MSKETEKAIQHISDILDEATKPIQQPQPPRVASDFASAMKGVIQAADDAESVRQHALDGAARYQGSQAYEDAVHDADAHYSESIKGLADAAKPAIQGIVGEMLREYQKNAMQPLPDNVFRLAQTFNMISRPGADVYQRYQNVFQDFPAAMEVLVSKYKADQPTYVPRFPDGVPFTPTEQLSDAEVQAFCDRLLRNSYTLIDSLVGDKFDQITEAQTNGIRNAANPIDVLRVTAMANGDGEVQNFLENVDSAYRPSIQDEAPEDGMERKYRESQSYQEIISAAEEQANGAHKASREYLDSICAADEQGSDEFHGCLIPKE